MDDNAAYFLAFPAPERKLWDYPEKPMFVIVPTPMVFIL